MALSSCSVLSCLYRATPKWSTTGLVDWPDGSRPSDDMHCPICSQPFMTASTSRTKQVKCCTEYSVKTTLLTLVCSCWSSGWPESQGRAASTVMETNIPQALSCKSVHWQDIKTRAGGARLGCLFRVPDVPNVPGSLKHGRCFPRLAWYKGHRCAGDSSLCCGGNVERES